MALLIYGANGYTGTLIARRAAARGVPAILGGRQADAVNALAAELGRTARVFAVDDPAAVATALAGITVVLNCAGPFSRTAAPLVDACLRARAHYLDITGELAVLESLAARDAEARAAGVTLLPGAGFDVVPTDCLAAEAKHRLPTATHLALEEILSNVIRHGYAEPGKHEISVCIRVGDGRVDLQVEDDGREFDPLSAPEVDLDVPLEERRVGGLGIHLLRKMASEIRYLREDGRNRLRVLIRPAE